MSPFDPSKVEQIWSANFTFAGVKSGEWNKKQEFWKRSALETAELLSEGKNLVLRLDTGGGKTIIAILAAVALGFRTLFLTPTRYLTGQHRELLSDVFGYTSPSRVITGETMVNNRIWDDISERFVFATADAFYAALAAKHVSPEVFDLVVFDEIHRATGRYAYVLIAPELQKLGIRQLGLSASPGSTKEEVELVLLNAGFEMVSSLRNKMPYKSESYHFLPLSPEMGRADELGWKPLGTELVANLRESNLILAENWRCSAGELDTLCRQINALPTTRNTKHLRKVFAKYRLYLYGYHVFMTGSYYSFLEYVECEDGLAKRKRPSDRALLGEPLFRRLIATARAYLDEHPKVLELERLLKHVARVSGKAIVFFADKKTAQYCKDFLLKRGILTETVFGGAGKSVVKQRETIEALKDGSITAILATSVLHEGVSIAEVDLVVNYSVAFSGIARLQSGGRTGRMWPGHIAHFVLNHDIDRQVFFSVHQEMKKMKELSDKESKPLAERKGQLSLFVS